MKTIGCLFFLMILCSCSIPNARSIEGVYMAKDQPEQRLWLMVDGYSSQIHYKENVYISSEGGPFVLEGNRLQIHKEFDDQKPDSIGTDRIYTLKFTKTGFKDKEGILWEKQKSIVQDLDGAWKISGRVQDGEFKEINHSGSRKTIKLLRDGYFQWIAIEPDKKKFYGTGGGRYTFKDGTYTEKIEFFSKNNDRVGAKLNFEGEIKNGDWHHTGKSSQGAPMHEVWVPYHQSSKAIHKD